LLSRIDPSTGPTAGGTSISLRGANFVAGASVTIGGAAALSVVVASGGTITAKTPAHATGAVDVVVTNPNGQTSTLSGAFNYADPPGSSGSSSGKGCGGAGAPIGAWLGTAALLRRLLRRLRSRRRS
jgi:large repetitive protein